MCLRIKLFCEILREKQVGQGFCWVWSPAISYRWRNRHARFWGVVTPNASVGAARRSPHILDPYGRGACGACPGLPSL